MSNTRWFAIAISAAVHAVVLLYVSNFASKKITDKAVSKPATQVVLLQSIPAQVVPEKVNPVDSKRVTRVSIPTPSLATQAAPAVPTAEEWAFAAKYTLKNSKGYRYIWGKQVRSMMGTAVEGKDVGSVRFLIEIAPSGQITKLQTLWSTSDYVENLARTVMQKMPPLPPTSTGKVLVFEKTISFSPFVSDIPPLYKNDCHPDVPTYRNPFAWDGISEQKVETLALRVHLTEQELAECEKQLPKDSHDAESGYNRVTTKRWGVGSSKK